MLTHSPPSVRALAALAAEGATEDQLDGYLQRFDGDLWEELSGSPHATELMDAKYAHALEATADGLSRLRKGLANYLRATDAPAAVRGEWADVLQLAPQGFKTDRPAVRTYRRRLATLARSVAADIESARVG